MVPGVEQGEQGRAAQIVLDFRDHLGAPGDLAAQRRGRARPPGRAVLEHDQVQSGLVNLGWSTRDAEVDQPGRVSRPTPATPSPTCPTAFRAALRRVVTAVAQPRGDALGRAGVAELARG